MFSCIQFSDAIDSYQMLLREGILDPSLCGDEEWKKVKTLALTNLTKCSWLECYKQKKVLQWLSSTFTSHLFFPFDFIVF
jgi:hypothetical protein